MDDALDRLRRPPRGEAGDPPGALALAPLERAHARVGAHGDAERPPVPGQVGGPALLGDEAERLPAPVAVLRLVPGARRQAGDAEVGADHVLGRSQRVHAREVEPGPGAIERVLVDDEQVPDALAHQTERGRQTALPRADDDDVEDGLVRRPCGARRASRAAGTRAGRARGRTRSARRSRGSFTGREHTPADLTGAGACAFSTRQSRREKRALRACFRAVSVARLAGFALDTRDRRFRGILCLSWPHSAFLLPPSSPAR